MAGWATCAASTPKPTMPEQNRRRAVVRLMEPGDQASGALCGDRYLASSLPLLRADERKTQQVLFNLHDNAVKFTPSGGHISVFARFDPQSGLSIGLVDTWIAKEAENLDRVYEPFVQIDSQLNRQHQGTGLGLAIIKQSWSCIRTPCELKSIKEMVQRSARYLPAGSAQRALPAI